MKQIKWLFFILLLLGFSHADDQPLNILQSVAVQPSTANTIELHFFFAQPLPNLPTHFSLSNPARLVLDIQNAKSGLKERKMQLTGIVEGYTVADMAGRLRIMLNLKQASPFQMKLVDRQLVLMFPNAGGKLPLSTSAVEKPDQNNTPITSAGKRLSFNFQDIKVRAALQLIAEFTGLNIVVSDTVEGSMSLHLQDVPWEQALDVILKTQGLGQRRIGDTLLIAPLGEIASRQKQELQAQQQIADLEPLKSELITVNYSKADDLAKLLKDKGNSVLSSRGTVTVDSRTNTLWVLDTPAKLAEVRALVKRLDVSAPQVLIEARVVSIDKTREMDLGVRFGITKLNRFSGTLNGANEIAGGTAPTAVASYTDRLNFNLPAAPTGGQIPGSVGVALMKLVDNTFLDLELSALETEGALQIISTPRLITANQQSATIENGQEIPYQQATSSGATSVDFKKAVLSLTVTPQITPDNKVVLTLKVNQDKVSSLVVQQVPAIDTSSIETNVLVKNGQTIVLGGVYTQTDNNTVERIPFLGKLPVVGALFTNKQTKNEQFELLIFVTPKIIPHSGIAGA